MTLCTGDCCDRKDTCCNYYKNADISKPFEVESFASSGSMHICTDTDSKNATEMDIQCGPNGQYKMYKEIEKIDEAEEGVGDTETLSCKIKLSNFTTMLNAIKNITTSEKEKYGRDILKFIQITVTKESVIAIACNGYQLSRYTLLQPNEEEFTCYIKPFYFRTFQWMEDSNVVINYNKESNLVSIKMPATFGSVNYEFTQPKEEYPNIVIKALEDARENSSSFITLNPALLNVSSKSFIRDKCTYMNVFAPKSSSSPIYCKAALNDVEKLEHILLPVGRR